MAPALVWFVVASCPVQAAENLIPPLAAPAVLTSSFGEYRSGHYHGGLDYSTGGAEGLPVRAPADGWVYRLRASGVGYGRAIYYRIEDGRTVLLAHLSRFHPGIEGAVQSEQDSRGRYEVDFYPGAGELSYEAGDVLGYSGQSGSGPPHLHAEIRIGEDAAVAINPLTQGWNVQDPVPPILSRLRAEPAGPGIRVNNGVDPVVIDLRERNPAPLHITGPVRLWVETGDQAAGGAYPLAPHRVGARLDGEALSEVAFERFHWNWAREVEWTFHNALARSRNERWVCLEPPPRTRQSVAEARIPGGDWTAGLLSGEHRLQLFASDLGGNETRVELPLVLAYRDSGEKPISGPPLTHTELVSRGRFLEFRVATTDSGDVVAVSPNGTRSETGWTRDAAPGGWICQLERPEPPVPGLWSFAFRAGDRDSLIGFAVWTGPGGRGDTISWAGSGPRGGVFQMDLPPEATYGPMWITIRTEPEIEGEAGSELEPVGLAVAMGPWVAPLRERVRIGLAPPRTVPSRRGLSVHSFNRGKWSFEGADTTGTGVGAQVLRLEKVALFRDLVAPAVAIDRPGSGLTITARIEDDGVGVVWPGVSMVLNGETLIAEWDPESDRLTAFLRSELEPGDYELVVSAEDRVGNRSEESMRFTVP
jgi:hypothetical protein